MFSLIEESEDFYEVQIIERIKDDYDRFHKHDFVMFEKMKSTDNIQCPRCGSTKFISHGKDISVKIVEKHLMLYQTHCSFLQK